MPLPPKQRRLVLRAALIIAEYAKCIRDSEVNGSGPHKGSIDDADVRAELAEYRNVIDGLIELGRDGNEHASAARR